MSPANALVTAALAGGLMAAVAPASAATFKKLVDFSIAPNGGANPMSGVFYRHGALLGTTQLGGADNVGIIYKYKPGKNSVFNQVQILHGFESDSDLPDVGWPESDPALQGNVLYGSTGASGRDGLPGIYSFDLTSGTETMVYAWASSTEGSLPNGIMLMNGMIYGTTFIDSVHQAGTVFSVDPAAGTETALYAFRGNGDGAGPLAGLANVNGVLFGTTSTGGANNVGTIFSFDPATGRKSTLYSFDPAKDGAFPRGTMVYAQGLLYGTTFGGGPANAGAVFSFDPVSATEVTLHGFNGRTEGRNPIAPLLYADGRLFGTTSTGGAGGGGTIFEINRNTGHETLLHSFSGPDGAGPVGALHVHNGVFYGTTYAGGVVGTGTIFQFTR